MLHAEHSVTINRPPQTVFDYLADGTNNRDWRSDVVEIHRTTETNWISDCPGRSRGS